MLQLTSAQRKFLRGAAHDLKPVVMIGKLGLSDSALAEIDSALKAHELIKIRFVDLKDQKKEISSQVETRLEASCAGIIGAVSILYRPNPEKKRRIRLPE